MATDNRQRLIIRVSRASLAFSTTNGTDVIYERYPLKSNISISANMREALRNVPMLQDAYRRVVVMVDSPVLMTPTDLYREEDEDSLYRYTFTGMEQHAVVHAVVPDLNAVAVFSIHKDLRIVLLDHYGEALTFQPLMISVWRHLFQKSFTGPHQKLFGHFHDRHLEVFAFNQNRFKFCNSYAVSGEPDNALYYLLSVWKQLGMNPREDELHLSGEMQEREQLKEKAQTFVKRVYFGNPSGEFNRAPVTQVEGMPYDLMMYYLKGR